MDLTKGPGLQYHRGDLGANRFATLGYEIFDKYDNEHIFLQCILALKPLMEKCGPTDMFPRFHVLIFLICNSSKDEKNMTSEKCQVQS